MTNRTNGNDKAGGGDAVDAPRRSRLAIWSLVLGCLFFIPPLGLVALILGIVAIVKVTGSRGALSGKGLAISGVVLGGLSLILMCSAMPVALLFPALTKARAQARSVTCRSNLKQVGLAVAMYQADYSNEMPPDLQILVDNGYIRDARILKCPASRSPRVDTTRVDATSDYVYVHVPDADELDLDEAVPIAWDRTIVHGRGVNVLFSTCVVRFVPTEEFDRIIDANAEKYSTPPTPPLPPPESGGQ